MRHPEGLLFKELCNHERELLELYKNLSNREDVAKMEASIAALVDSTNNSINENCARIKEAFVCEFDESVAAPYILYGKYPSPKSIALDRSLITDQSGLVMKSI